MSVEDRSEIYTLLESVTDKVDTERVESLLILIKSDGRYTRYSTSIEDVTDVLGQLEILKADILRRM